MPILTNVRENEWKRETEGENGKMREIFLKFFGTLVAKGFAHLTAEPAVSSSNPAVTPRNSRVLNLTINFCLLQGVCAEISGAGQCGAPLGQEETDEGRLAGLTLAMLFYIQ